MAKKARQGGHGFGTAPFFLAAISTILGAILFLRFGYAVGHSGLAGAILIVLIGHAITIPTGLAVAEIATLVKPERSAALCTALQGAPYLIGATDCRIVLVNRENIGETLFRG